MPNPFYNVTNNPIARTLGRSDVMRAEFALVEDGFDATKAALDLKAPLAGPTFTGTVTFNTAAVNVTAGSVDASSVSSFLVPTVSPVSDATNKAASTAFVIAAIGASGTLLPPQVTHAGKFLRTDGVSASWQDPPAPSWAAVTGKPTTLQGYGITNAQFALEIAGSSLASINPHRLTFRDAVVTRSGDGVEVRPTHAYPHFLLLEQGII